MSAIVTPDVTKCIFCGGVPLTWEHVFPVWSHKYMTKQKGKYKASFESAYLTHSEHREWKGKGDVHDWQVKCVCENCNNGWMRKYLEEPAMRIMAPMMTGRPTVLTANDQRTLAAWAVLKSIIGEHDPYQGIAVSRQMERKYLMRRKRPPDRRCKVWIGNYERGAWPIHWLAHPFSFTHDRSELGSAPDDFNSVITTQVIGQVFIHVIRTPMTLLIDKWAFASPVSEMLRTIWPIGKSMTWPPPSMKDGDADDAANAIWRFMERRIRELLPLHQLPPAQK